ncbi:MAG: hypothetical protein ACJATE_002401 [Bacteroidia bacterium]
MAFCFVFGVKRSFIGNLFGLKPGLTLDVKHVLYVRSISIAYQTSFRKISLLLSGFFSENVTLERVLPLDFSRARYFETFLGTGICLNLWHDVYY